MKTRTKIVERRYFNQNRFYLVQGYWRLAEDWITLHVSSSRGRAEEWLREFGDQI